MDLSKLRRTLLALISVVFLCVNVIIADVITFEKSGLPAKHDPAKHAGTEEEIQHLPLSSLFSQSDRYQCMIEGKRELCTEDDVNYMKDKFNKFGEDFTQEQPRATQTQNVKTKVEQLESGEGVNDELAVDDGIITDRHHVIIGPRYQPIHLYLPRKPMYQVS